MSTPEPPFPEQRQHEPELESEMDPRPDYGEDTCVGAITTFTRGLAQELAPKGIRVNGVAPGPVWTPLIPMSFDPESVSTFGEDNPMGRPAQPAELAPLYVFLASEESRFIAGEIIGVTGGELR